MAAGRDARHEIHTPLPLPANPSRSGPPSCPPSVTSSRCGSSCKTCGFTWRRCSAAETSSSSRRRRQKRFQQIDKAFIKMVHSAVETMNAVNVCYGNEAMISLLPHLTEQLELCQKSLTAFLDTKRAQFPAILLSSPTRRCAGDSVAPVRAPDGDPRRLPLGSCLDSATQVTFDKNDKFKMPDHVLPAGRGREVPEGGARLVGGRSCDGTSGTSRSGCRIWWTGCRTPSRA